MAQAHKKIEAVVGLDLSLTATGVVRLPLSSLKWSQELITTKPANGKVWLRYEMIVKDILGLLGPNDVVLIEDYAFAARAARARLIAELGGLVKFACWKKTGYWPFEIPPTSLKKYATGRGNTKKSDIRLAVYRKTQLDFDDDNLADAYVLTQIGLGLLGHDPIPKREQPDYERGVLAALTKKVMRERQEALKALAKRLEKSF